MKIFLAKIFLGENFLGKNWSEVTVKVTVEVTEVTRLTRGKFLCENFLGEKFLGEIFMVKIFGVKIFWGENFLV